MYYKLVTARACLLNDVSLAIGMAKHIAGIDVSKRPLRIAVVGMDGSGKSTVVGSMIKRFQGKYRFELLKALPRPTRTYAITNWVERKLDQLALKGDELSQKHLLIVSQAIQNAIYPFLRIGAEKKKDIIIYERHPLIDYETYGPYYGGKAATKMGKFLSAAPHPDIIIHLDVSPEKAYRQVLSRIGAGHRKKVPHLHESLGELRKVRARFDKAISKLVSQNPKTIVIRIDANKPKNEMLKSLHAELDHLGLL